MTAVNQTQLSVGERFFYKVAGLYFSPDPFCGEFVCSPSDFFSLQRHVNKVSGEKKINFP